MTIPLAFTVILVAQQTAPPTDWSALPVFPLPRASFDDPFVRAEIATGRCRVPAGQAENLVAPVAILIGPAGAVRQIVPQAIGCPTVEQYTVGYLLSLTRAGHGGAVPPAPGWYRLTVTYRR